MRKGPEAGPFLCKPILEWTRKELLLEERGYGDQIRAKIIRCAAVRNERYLSLGIVVAANSSLGSMIAAVASLFAIYHLS